MRDGKLHLIDLGVGEQVLDLGDGRRVHLVDGTYFYTFEDEERLRPLHRNGATIVVDRIDDLRYRVSEDDSDLTAGGTP